MRDYQKKQWRKKRLAILKRDAYQCREAKRYGKTEAANTVHHIYPIDHYPEIKYKSWNLISLSAANHNKMHDRETNAITEKGQSWQKRKKREFDLFYTPLP